jgi:voltage-gated potassium channel
MANKFIQSYKQNYISEKVDVKPEKLRLYNIIYEADTPAGKLFDIVLLILILISVADVMLESVKEFREQYGLALRILDWTITILFTIEYATRIYVLTKPKKYIFSFFGIIDLLSILPTYLSFFIVGSQSLSVIRAIRLIRVFRILKLVRYMGEANSLLRAILSSRVKIFVFLGFVFILTIIVGSIMYVIEGPSAGFHSIPRAVYWAIVTITTVGYGDIAPQTPIGQFIAALMMIVGYGIIAVPTGLITADIAISNSKREQQNLNQTCTNCNTKIKDEKAKFCSECGHKLD